MIKLITLLMIVCSTAFANEADDFSIHLFSITLKGDFDSYSKLLSSECSFNDKSEKSFQLRSNLLKKLKPGHKIILLPIKDHRDLKIKNGNPFIDSYKVEPSYYAIVRPVESSDSNVVRIDLNPIVRSHSGLKILDGSCVISS